MKDARSGDTQDTVVHSAAFGDEVAQRFGQHTRDAKAAFPAKIIKEHGIKAD